MPRWFRPEYLLIILAIVIRLIPGPRTIDDAYITFRYSQNILEGNGLVYNPGQAILGTTTPLYAILLSLFGSFFGGSLAPFPILAQIINAVADGFSCLILLILGRKAGYPNAGLATSLLWAFAPMSVTFAIGGMETSVFILLLLGSLYMYSSHQPVAAALLAAFSILTRPDALLAVVLLLVARGLHYLKKSPHRPSTAELLAFILPLLAWSLFGWLTYGSPIPQTIAAKSVVYSLPKDAALIRLLQHYATPFQGNLLFGRYYLAFGLLFFPSLAIIGWRRVLQKHLYLWPLAIFPLLYFLAYSIANPLLFRWYLAPPLPLYLLGIMLGLEVITRELKRLKFLGVGSVIFMAFTLNAWTLKPDHGPQRPAPKMAYIRLEELYIQAARDLMPVLSSDSVIAAGDIGAVGFFSQATIVDMVGLITPEVLDYFPLPDDSYVINYAIPSALVTDIQPDYVIILEIYGRRTLLLDSVFQETYALRREYPTDIYGSEAMLVFEHR